MAHFFTTLIVLRLYSEMFARRPVFSMAVVLCHQTASKLPPYSKVKLLYAFDTLSWNVFKSCPLENYKNICIRFPALEGAVLLLFVADVVLVLERSFKPVLREVLSQNRARCSLFFAEIYCIVSLIFQPFFVFVWERCSFWKLPFHGVDLLLSMMCLKSSKRR